MVKRESLDNQAQTGELGATPGRLARNSAGLVTLRASRKSQMPQPRTSKNSPIPIKHMRQRQSAASRMLLTALRNLYALLRIMRGQITFLFNAGIAGVSEPVMGRTMRRDRKPSRHSAVGHGSLLWLRHARISADRYPKASSWETALNVPGTIRGLRCRMAGCSMDRPYTRNRVSKHVCATAALKFVNQFAKRP